MTTEIILFSVCVGLGILSRFWYKGLLSLERKMKNRPAAIVFEFLSVGLLTAAVLALVFFIGDGVFAIYTVLGVGIGFVLTSMFV